MTTALMIIDVQKGMFAFPQKLHDGDGTVARLAGVITRARAAGAPVIFIQHDGGADDPFFGADKPGFAIYDDLKPLAGEQVVVKRKSSAFHGTDLDARLKALGVDKIVIGGMQSEFCVNSAIRGAYERDYRLILIEDGHSTFPTASLTAAQVVTHQNETLSDFAKPVKAADIRFD